MGRQGASVMRVALSSFAVALVYAQEDAPARRLGFGTITADAGNPTMSTMGTMPGMAPGMSPMMGMPQQQGALPMMSPQQSMEVSHWSSEFVQAMVAGFLAKSKLQKGELDCIVDGSGSIGGNVGRVAGQFGMILKQSFGKSMPDIPGLPDGSASPGGSPASLGDGAGGIEDMVNQINAQSSSTGGSSISTAGFDGNAAMSPQLKQALAKLQAAQASSLGGAAPPPPAAASAAAAAAPAAQAASSAAASPKAGVSNPSLDLFYNSGRRLQLPGMPTPAMGQQGGMGAAGAVPFAMEMGFSMQSIVKESKELVGECVHSDAKAQFERAGNHMLNLQYLTGHFLANGADIVEELADSVMAYEHQNVTQFGYDFGKALRKVLLSNNTNGQLPEGMPGEEELGNVTSGLMQGFWGPGTYMDIKLKKDPNNPVHIDMNTCVKENIAFFQQVWAATMYVFAQKATQGAHKGLNSDKGKLQFGTTVAFTMLEIPTALKKCNVSPDQEQAVMDAIKAMGHGMSPHFTLPSTPVSKDQLTNDFAKAIKHWSEHRWFEFGHDLGVFMQESAVKFYPEKYSIDASGLLHRQILQPVSSGSFALFLLPAALLFFAAGLVAVKHRRMISSWRRELQVEQGRFAAGAMADLEAAQSQHAGHFMLVERSCSDDAVE